MRINNNSQYISTQVIQSLKKLGFHNIVISPGLRNAPLINAAVEDGLKIYSAIDERSAGYLALGLSKGTKTPTILLCTSGTAALNYLPSTAEAFKSNIPLIIVTSDRPHYLIKANSNQTIEQLASFKPFTEKQLEISADTFDKEIKSISTFFNHLTSIQKPVQINIHLEEPLDNRKANISIEKEVSLDLTINKKQVDWTNPLPQLEINEALKKSKNPLLIIGSGSYSKYEIDLIKKLKVPKTIDITSGIKSQVTLDDYLVPSFDHPEVRKFYDKNKVDLVIKLGQYVVTKHLTSLTTSANCIIFEENISNNQEVAINQKEDRHIIDRKLIIDQLIKYQDNSNNIDFLVHQSNLWYEVSQKKRALIDSESLSFPYISKYFLDSNVKNASIILSNSTIVRSFDYYIPKNYYPMTSSYYYNRGVSGIEGFLSMTQGISESTKKPTILFIGDISFLYDLNSLYLISKNKPIAIFLLNNNSGGIFNSIPIELDKDTLGLMTTKHQTDFQKLTEAFGIRHQFIKTKKEYEKAVKELNSLDHTTIFECIIKDDVSSKLFKKLQTLSN